MEKVIQLDTTNKCNLKCIFCNKYLNQNCQPETFFMSVKEAKKLLYENEDYLAITLQNNGEFFLNPEWEKILELTFKRASEKKCKIILATNGTLVNREKASVICELAELYKAEIYITVSINVLSSELYQKIMGYNLCEQVIENTEYLIEYSNKKTEFVNVSVQFMVMEKTAGKEAETFINFWKDFFEKKHIEYDIVRDGYPSEKRFLVSLRRCYTGKREDFYTYENELKRLKNIFNIKEIKEKIETCDNVFKRKICSYLFEAPVVRDNIKCICCRDLNFENSFNLDNPAASEIEKYYKSIHYTGYFEKINVCNYCLNFPYVDEYKQYNKFCCDFAEKSYFNRLKKGVSFDFYNIDFSDNDEKKRAELFLKNNNYNALCGNLSDEVSFFKGKWKGIVKKEVDFCAGWKLELEFDKGKIKTGCKIFKYKIQNFENYSKMLEEGNLALIPEFCKKCDKKFSYNSLKDRFRIFGMENFYSPEPDVLYFKEECFLIYKLSLEKKLDKVKEILNKHNKIVYYIEFIKYAKSLELFNEPETKEIFEQIKNNSIIFSECSIEEILL